MGCVGFLPAIAPPRTARLFRRDAWPRTPLPPRRTSCGFPDGQSRGPRPGTRDTPRACPPSDRLDDLLALRLLHARVVGALGDHQRDLDLVRLEQRRPRLEELASSSMSPTRTEKSFFSGSQYGGMIDSARSPDWTARRCLTAQAKLSGVKVGADQCRVTAVGTAHDRHLFRIGVAFLTAQLTASIRSSCILPAHSRSPALTGTSCRNRSSHG